MTAEHLPFDPSAYSVKEAKSFLDSLDLEQLDALRDAELEGKNRITLITAIDEFASERMEDREGQDWEDNFFAAWKTASHSAPKCFSRTQAREHRLEEEKERAEAARARERLPKSKSPALSDPAPSYTVTDSLGTLPVSSLGTVLSHNRWVRAQLLAQGDDE